jgi:hypothetical protein
MCYFRRPGYRVLLRLYSTVGGVDFAAQAAERCAFYLRSPEYSTVVETPPLPNLFPSLSFHSAIFLSF